MRVETSIMEQRGIGKPDYTRQVSSGKERAGISLQYLQQLSVFGLVFTDQVAHPSPYPWIQPPLAAGATAHLIDFSTGLALPYNLLAGYVISLIEKAWATTQDIEIWGFIDALIVGCPGIQANGVTTYFNTVLPYSTALFDPTGAGAHTLDLTVTNISADALEGALDFTGILEAVGTKWPETKDCQCPVCHHIQTESVHATAIKCQKCSFNYHVLDLTRIKEL